MPKTTEWILMKITLRHAQDILTIFKDLVVQNSSRWTDVIELHYYTFSRKYV